MKAVKITKGDKSITIARPRRGAGAMSGGRRGGPRDGSGPRGGTAACPRFGGLTATSQLGK